MISISLMLYIIVTLVWIALAAFVTIRIPGCKNVPLGARMFVMAFLIMQLTTQAYTLYSVMTEQHVVKTTNSKTTRVNTDKDTVNAVSNYLMISFWFSIFLFIITLGVYYFLFKTIFMCKDAVISKKVFWLFLSATALQVAVASITKTMTNHKLMMNAMAN
jgi:hypothetical protein